tara:strand:- start:12238 stop:12720 length:483 start_codon:yes stop_codon:yes gene_type:complete
MTRGLFLPLIIFFLFSCSGVDFVLEKDDNRNRFKNKTLIVHEGENEQRFLGELFSYFGSGKGHDYILVTKFVESKNNIVVKKNQVAERVDYVLEVDYDLFYKKQDCRLFNKKISSTFSFLPKSFGYNFGADQSLNRLYSTSIKKNINNFVKLVPKENTCL